ncbi:MAG: exosortase-associated EpsI family protein [Phycisphaerales bacterium]|jgi:hypothetical protein
MKQPLAKYAGFTVAMVLLLGSSLGIASAISAFKLTLRKLPIYPESRLLLTSLPTETESWIRVGADRKESAEVEEVLGTKNYVSRLYKEKNPKDKAHPMLLDLHVAYYTGMIDTVPHVPDRCFVGGGMQIGDILGDLPLPLDRSRWREDTSVRPDMAGHIFVTRSSNGLYPRLPRDPQDIKLRTMRFVQKDGPDLFAGYFFIANGGTVAKAEEVRLLAFDLSSKYAYYAKVQVTTASVTSGEEMTKASASLLNELMGDIMTCLPDWVAVQQGDYVPAADDGAEPDAKH